MRGTTLLVHSSLKHSLSDLKANTEFKESLLLNCNSRVVTTQISFIRWSNVGKTVDTAMAHGWNTTLDQCSFDRWRMVG